MCTIGVLRLGDDDYLLFKNKDFVRQHFDDRIVIEDNLFGAKGVTTWAGTDPDQDVFSGFSIGANASGLLCCDSNVRTLPDHSNYDDLVEVALREGTDVSSAVAAVRSAVESGPYLWANLMMIDKDRSVSVEVKGSHAEVVPLVGPTARANHHEVLGANAEDDDTMTSLNRFKAAQRRVEAANTIEDIFELQRSHDDVTTGVCNHSLYQTVYSYVLRHRSGETSIYVNQGHPCESPAPEGMLLPIGGNWSVAGEGTFRAAYPSSHSLEMR
jgi:hypothetical protein